MTKRLWNPTESGDTSVDKKTSAKKSVGYINVPEAVKESQVVIGERLPEWTLLSITNQEPVHLVAIYPVVRLVKRIFNKDGATPHFSEKKEKMHILVGVTFSENLDSLTFEDEDRIATWCTHHIIVPSSVELAVQLSKLGNRYAS